MVHAVKESFCEEYILSPEWTITISPRYTVEHGDFAEANCGVSLCVIGKLISRWNTMIAVDHRDLGGSL
ncbi:hypothetical protein DPMN_077872 [Dreissena polymorpha]|uniref:Uncharacterized protein n=1 Tax=Dreissena polymorpha TaxID=45954 RepID=A0A9D3YMS2_DREPO|nr:hypothetical protein DPMN_077872 [Dreissena polymorpha]